MIFNLTVADILQEQHTPKYINTRAGFIKYTINGTTNKPTLLGFTPNLRTATPVYGDSIVAMELAKVLLANSKQECRYFAIVEPSLIGFVNKGS